MIYLPYLIPFFVAFISVALKGYQTINVVTKNYKGAAVTSFLMSISNVAFVGAVAYDPITSAIPAGLGSVFGVLLAMYLSKEI